MADHIGRCEASGMSASAYCKKHNLVLATFYYWREKIASLPPKSAFKEIKMVSPVINVIRIQYPAGTVIQIEGEVTAA
jgi:hypothetical protein